MSAPVTDAQPVGGFTLPGWLLTIMHIIITGGLPLLLVLINARLLMSGPFLRWEYNRPSFPPDPFGFTTQERLTYAPVALAYLFNNKGIDFLGSETFPDGSPLYNERELSHMHDVKNVTRGLMRFGFGLMAVMGICILLMAVDPHARPTLYRALLFGGILTVLLIIAALVAVATSFDWLFTEFHHMFFVGDSWLFNYSDTLIRLFPEAFWTDAFALMFGGALIEALILAGVMWRLLRR